MKSFFRHRALAAPVQKELGRWKTLGPRLDSFARNRGSFVFFCLIVIWVICRRYFKFGDPPIGVYIAALGFAAAAITIFPPPDNKRFIRLAWIVVFVMLMFLEVRNLYNDRDEHNQQQAQVSNSVREQGQTLSGMARNIQLSFDGLNGRESSLEKGLNTLSSVRTPVAAPPPVPSTVIAVSPSYGNLRERAIQLSQQLYGLVTGEQRDDQEHLANYKGANPAEVTHFGVVRMSSIYFEQYDIQVRQIREEFAQLHMRDPEIEEIYQEIAEVDKLIASGVKMDWRVNGGTVNGLASGLSNLASQLPASGR